jgi:hypothetical protein
MKEKAEMKAKAEIWKVESRNNFCFPDFCFLLCFSFLLSAFD